MLSSGAVEHGNVNSMFSAALQRCLLWKVEVDLVVDRSIKLQVFLWFAQHCELADSVFLVE